MQVYKEGKHQTKFHTT